MRDPMSAFDRIISEAQQEGKFDNLEGKGQPLVIDTSPDAVVRNLLKEANVSVAPEWITLAMEIDRLLEEDERALATYAAAYGADRAGITRGMSPPPSAAAEASAGAGEPRWRRWWRRLTHGSAPEPPLASDIRQATAVNELRRRWEQELARCAGRLHDCNRKIRRFNQLVPLANRQRPLLPVRERLCEFAERFPLPERAPEGRWQFLPGVVPTDLLSPPPEQEPTGRSRDPLQAAALQRMRQRGRRPPPIG